MSCLLSCFRIRLSPAVTTWDYAAGPTVADGYCYMLGISVSVIPKLVPATPRARHGVACYVGGGYPQQCLQIVPRASV